MKKVHLSCEFVSFGSFGSSYLWGRIVTRRCTSSGKTFLSLQHKKQLREGLIRDGINFNDPLSYRHLSLSDAIKSPLLVLVLSYCTRVTQTMREKRFIHVFILLFIHYEFFSQCGFARERVISRNDSSKKQFEDKMEKGELV